ncbi:MULTISPECIES: hypothetical protein [unclassified Microbacterium]|uniref:hypothetical protein n=1 Tax=unclassified Microbacterium TaxID=2609290 RepID=UPI00214CD6A2|nr:MULTISPECIES: hypothetical protein [unclassified Microbacterium]MCR2785430.1 hypothetical protein [Microbacterium sp. zg.B96]WIM14543.1 hypothetical protein QNO11_08110 [Microbacterium sp. zg-B96]
MNEAEGQAYLAELEAETPRWFSALVALHLENKRTRQMNEDQIPLEEPDVDGELLIYVTELPRFISVLRPGDVELTFYEPAKYEEGEEQETP